MSRRPPSAVSASSGGAASDAGSYGSRSSSPSNSSAKGKGKSQGAKKKTSKDANSASKKGGGKGGDNGSSSAVKRRLWKHKNPQILPLDEFTLQAFNEGEFEDDGRPPRLEYPLRDSSLGVPDFRAWKWFQDRCDPDIKIVSMCHSMLWHPPLLKRVNAHADYEQLPPPGPQPSKAIMTRIQRQRAKRAKAALLRWRKEKAKEPGWGDLKPPSTISRAPTTLGGKGLSSTASIAGTKKLKGKEAGSKKAGQSGQGGQGGAKRSVSPPSQRKVKERESQSPPRGR